MDLVEFWADLPPLKRLGASGKHQAHLPSPQVVFASYVFIESLSNSPAFPPQLACCMTLYGRMQSKYGIDWQIKEKKYHIRFIYFYMHILHFNFIHS